MEFLVLPYWHSSYENKERKKNVDPVAVQVVGIGQSEYLRRYAVLTAADK
jgi:hypothetical protein